jgi:uncharacterized tellurite resistance protein B-like protein
MFKFLYKNKLDLESEDNNLFALRLLIQLALADGKIDELEFNALKKFIDKKSIDKNVAALLEKEINDVEISTSFFEEINQINSEYKEIEKVKLLEEIWALILVDGVVDPYEENLYYRVGDLLKIKRSFLNKIKSRF